MFRKLVSSLPLSPVLAGQLASYARRFRKQQAMRRLGLIFTVLALIVQIFVVTNPPEQVQAAVAPTTSPYSMSGGGLIRSKTASNLSQLLSDATVRSAQPAERIEYTLRTQNTTKHAITTTIDENLSDALEYSTLNDDGGGAFDQTSQVLRWSNITIGAGQTDVRRFSIQLLDSIPATPRGSNNHYSYDCTITNTYGNTLNIPVACPASKLIEDTIKSLPATSLSQNIIFGSSLLIISLYFYIRSRQLNKEVHLLRKEFDGGTI